MSDYLDKLLEKIFTPKKEKTKLPEVSSYPIMPIISTPKEIEKVEPEKEKLIKLEIFYKPNTINMSSLTISSRFPSNTKKSGPSVYKDFLKWYYGRPHSKNFLYHTWLDDTYTDIIRDNISYIRISSKIVNKENK